MVGLPVELYLEIAKSLEYRDYLEFITTCKKVYKNTQNLLFPKRLRYLEVSEKDPVVEAGIRGDLEFLKFLKESDNIPTDDKLKRLFKQANKKNMIDISVYVTSNIIGKLSMELESKLDLKTFNYFQELGIKLETYCLKDSELIPYLKRNGLKLRYASKSLLNNTDLLESLIDEELFDVDSSLGALIFSCMNTGSFKNPFSHITLKRLKLLMKYGGDLSILPHDYIIATENLEVIEFLYQNVESFRNDKTLMNIALERCEKNKFEVVKLLFRLGYTVLDQNYLFEYQDLLSEIGYFGDTGFED